MMEQMCLLLIFPKTLDLYNILIRKNKQLPADDFEKYCEERIRKHCRGNIMFLVNFSCWRNKICFPAGAKIFPQQIENHDFKTLICSKILTIRHLHFTYHSLMLPPHSKKYILFIQCSVVLLDLTVVHESFAKMDLLTFLHYRLSSLEGRITRKNLVYFRINLKQKSYRKIQKSYKNPKSCKQF